MEPMVNLLTHVRASVSTWNNMAAPKTTEEGRKRKSIPRGKPKSGRVWKSEKKRSVPFRVKCLFKVNIATKPLYQRSKFTLYSLSIHSLLDNMDSLEQTTFTLNRIRNGLSFYHIRFYDKVFFKLLIRKATGDKIASERLRE